MVPLESALSCACERAHPRRRDERRVRVGEGLGELFRAPVLERQELALAPQVVAIVRLQERLVRDGAVEHLVLPIRLPEGRRPRVEALAKALDLFVSVVVGFMSDATRTRFGRRLPYIAVGAFFAPIAMWYLAAPPDEWNLLVDESHVSLPQLKAMHAADQRRKHSLVAHGFRLPSASHPAGDRWLSAWPPARPRDRTKTNAALERARSNANLLRGAGLAPAPPLFAGLPPAPARLSFRLRVMSDEMKAAESLAILSCSTALQPGRILAATASSSSRPDRSSIKQRDCLPGGLLG